MIFYLPPCQDDEYYEQTADVRSQLRFFEQLERIEKQRKDEQEREILLKAAKVSYCNLNILSRVCLFVCVCVVCVTSCVSMPMCVDVWTLLLCRSHSASSLDEMTSWCPCGPECSCFPSFSENMEKGVEGWGCPSYPLCIKQCVHWYCCIHSLNNSHVWSDQVGSTAEFVFKNLKSFIVLTFC